MTTAIRCDVEGDDSWTCVVIVHDVDRELSTHRVRVRASDLRRLAPGAADPTELVESSFAFLLGREPPGSILRTFDLMEIGQYFPEYERAIVRRMAG